MAGPVPTLGYRSRSQAALALRQQGLKHREIAARIGVAEIVVAALIHSAKRANRSSVRGTVQELRLMLGRDTLNALDRAAAARKTSVILIAARLLTQAARDNLIDAILDDGAER